MRRPRSNSGDRLGRLGGEVLAARRERRARALFEVGEALEGRFEPRALRFVLGDRHRQRPAAAIERAGSVTNLLVEEEERGAVGNLLFGGRNAAADQGRQGLEHEGLRGMNIVHERMLYTYFEQRSSIILNGVHKEG
jgi:hypothetical protein